MQNHDKIIKETIYSNRYPKSKYVKNKERYPNITYYLENRFEYVDCISESLARINEGLEIRPVCPVCGNKVKYCGNSIKTKYTHYCSSKCSNNCPDKKQKTIDTCLKRYGVINGGCSKQALEKIKQTNLLRIGVSNPFKSKEIRKKIEETNYKKYKTKVPSKSIEVKQKTKETCLERYGTSYFFKVMNSKKSQ